MAGKKGSYHYKSLYDIDRKIKELYGNDRFIIEEDFNSFNYENVHQHIRIKCTKCGHSYSRRINSILHGYECKYCAGRYFENSTELKDYIKNITNNEYELLSDNYKTREKGIFRHNSPHCRKDDKLFEMKIHNFTVLKQRCPFCNSSSKGIIKSRGNTSIREYLDSHNIKYSTEYKFDGLRDKDSNMLLSFDIFVEDLNLLIEYDGIQHFEPIAYFGGEKAFLKTVEHDKQKNEFIKNLSDYNLLRIKYTDFFKIDEILEKTFNDYRKHTLEEISKERSE